MAVVNVCGQDPRKLLEWTAVIARARHEHKARVPLERSGFLVPVSRGKERVARMILEVLARNAFEEFAAGMLKPVAALAIVGMAIALSLVQRLQLEQEMVTSIARAFVQLALIGFILQFIFEQKNAVWIFVAYTFMVIVAGYTAGRRARHVPRSPYIAGISIFIGTGVTLALLLLLRVFPLTPRYMIPVSGMMVGNSMTVTGVAMKNLLFFQVETALALGATPSQAIKRPMKRTLILALSPVLDNTKTVGLISLPGAMTGLIMGGASPLEAVRLQMVVMNMLVGAATFSSLVAAYLSWQYFFTKTMQVETKVFKGLRNLARILSSLEQRDRSFTGRNPREQSEISTGRMEIE